jgi:ADP-ribose pyrophosphatase
VATRATTSDVVLSAPLHTKARGLDDNGQMTPYPRGGPVRYAVEDRVVHWDTPLPGYDPVEYTAPSVAAGPAWADPESPEGLRFGELDGKVDRTSFFPSGYKIVQRRPQNPMGRTGMKGRGLLGRWGPNHAADPVVTRWSPSNPAVLEFVAILRSDGGGWAIPGGMVEVGHSIGQTLRAEFAEEALNSLGKSEAERQTIDAALETLFDGGKCVYAGYVDDPRNTDNAWMETCCYHFHAESSSPLAQIELHAGDDAVGVKWTPITKDLKLYASHKMFIEAIGRKMGANPL